MINSVRWKLNKHNDLVNAGMPHNIFLDIFSKSYKEKTFEIWRQYPSEYASRLGCFFSEDTPKEYLKEVFVEGIYNVDGFLPDYGDLVVDAGANYGDSAIWWAKCFGAKVIAFEPLKDIFDVMQKNVILNNVEVDAYNIALGNGKKLFGHRSGVMFISGNTGMGQTFESATLDSFGLQQLDLLKIDVEGFEMDVLQGARETIMQFLPRIIIETHTSLLQKQCDEFLKECGYKIRQRGRFIMSRDPGMDRVQNLFYST